MPEENGSSVRMEWNSPTFYIVHLGQNPEALGFKDVKPFPSVTKLRA